jgi:hypothetical protein
VWHRKINTTLFHLHIEFLKVEFIKLESRMMVTRSCGRELGRWKEEKERKEERKKGGREKRREAEGKESDLDWVGGRWRWE